MVEIGLLASAAVSILGDLLAGVVEGAAATTVSDLVTSRLRGAAGGDQALARLEEQPQDPARRMEAASALVTAAQDDSEYTERLREALNVYSQTTNQGTSTSGSPHHQINIGGAGVSGRGHMIANGNIDARQKRNIRIGFGVLAVALVAFGGYKVVQWAGDEEGVKTDGQSSSQDGNVALPLPGGVESAPTTPQEKKVEFDLSGSSGNQYTEDFSRARGEVSFSVGQPYKGDASCSVEAPSGTSIVPVTVRITNTNDPAWGESEKFEPDVATVSFSKPPASWTILSRTEQVPCGTQSAMATGIRSGMYNEATFLIVGLPEGKETKVNFAVFGPSDALSPYGDDGEATTLDDGTFWKPAKVKIIPISVKG
ncbi:hypothetical protein PV387_15440 [Streptomyces sp. ME02-6987-2C]|uniref:hypothetical protein n=1 Tax=unclassified Streptomyces TaxID=2593676 RepID=UPI00087A4087|nr:MULTISPECIES: hypothetical protein [unclassified Streptomyces]MDX3367413.1 hypothetical protein [Streptomyces sp. ME02-6987-2C]MDX3423771.1 hypothetical protein [Streptomyces sp. ME02-6985-2c]REH20670.1 hypothetical protein BX268_2454 [Streptomyces sp. 2221.1]SDT31876.1 hypothetical protein SAMN05428941_2449 [Streptomyces sp. 2114.2]